MIKSISCKLGGGGSHPKSRQAMSSRPAWCTEFQDIQGNTEKPCLKRGRKEGRKEQYLLLFSRMGVWVSALTLGGSQLPVTLDLEGSSALF